MPRGTARPIAIVKNMRGNARIYGLNPPMDNKWHYVLVSAVEVDFSGPETYIFPCTVSGKILSWTELRGSFQGGLDHTRALKNAGYRIV